MNISVMVVGMLWLNVLHRWKISIIMEDNQWPTSEANIKQDWLELKTPTVEKKKGDGEGNKEITAHKLEILLNKSKWYKNERKNVLICTVFKKPTICISKSRDLEHIFPQFVHQFCIHYVACNPGSLDCGLQKRTSRQRSTIKPVNCFSNNYWPLGEHNWNIYISSIMVHSGNCFIELIGWIKLHSYGPDSPWCNDLLMF